MESLDKEFRDMLLDLYPAEFVDRPDVQRLFKTHPILSTLKLPEPDPEPYHQHVLAAPLIEVVSVSLTNYGNNEISHKIYGTIQVTDGEGATFYLYNRKVDNSETISNNGTLTLTLPKGCSITSSNLVKVEIDLKDSAHDGAEFVKGFFDWDYMLKDDYDYYDEINTQVVDGKGASAIVEYFPYRHAAIATVDVTLLMGKPFGREGVGTYTNVFGKIVAHHGSNFSTILFDKKINESIEVECFTCIEFSRHSVAAPVWSSFKIDTKLCNRDTQEQIVEETVEFCVFDYGKLIENLEGQNGLVQVLVEVFWSHPYAQPPLGRMVEGASSEKSIQHLIPDQQHSSAMSINRNLLSDIRNTGGFEQIEFFSVSICGRSDEDIDLWGSIEFEFVCSRDRISLFNKEKTSPQRLLPYQTLPMASYTNYLDALAFAVFLNLRDVSGRIISRGEIFWGSCNFEMHLPLLNRQLCSVVQGVDGYYAAVHYSIFTAGAQTMVKIYLKDKKPTMKCVKVDGSVCTQYSNFDYSSLYHNEYYRRKLFARKSNEPWLQYSDSGIMLLSESSVIVPKGSSLILDVNLKVYPPTNIAMGDDGNISDDGLQVGDSFLELLEFKVDDMGCLRGPKIVHKEIEGSSHQIVIHVEWREAYP